MDAPSSSFLLYQAYDQLHKGNQAGVIAEYRRLLSRSNLTASEEVKLRKALGELYVAALQESTDVALLPSDSSYAIENPFIEPAKKEFKRVLELDPNDSVAHYYMGRIFWMQHLENYALEELKKSREADPKNPSPLRYLAQIHLERGDARIGRDEALQSLALSPQYDEARLILVKCLAELGETTAALAEYDRLSLGFRSGPDAQAEYALLLMKANRWNDAARVLGVGQSNSSANGRLLIATGRYLLKRGRPRDASGAFGQAAALMPRSAWPLAWSVSASALNGNCEQSQRVSQLLTEALPRWPWSYWARAWNDLCHSNVDAAVQSLNEALRLAPDFSEAFELEARLFLDTGRYPELGTLLRPLINKETHRSFAYAAMAESLLDQQNAALAAEVAETAIRHDENNVGAFLVLGTARLNLGDRSGSQRAFTTRAPFGWGPPARGSVRGVGRTFRRGSPNGLAKRRAGMAGRSGYLVFARAGE